jgi:hypothetical protein
MREIEKILYDLHKDKSNDKVIEQVIKAYNLGLQDAADNAKHGIWYPDAPYSGNTGSELFVDDKDIGEPKSYIDKESILKLKI